jgi:glycosyltransferase involved in cell wall biosynthesis
MRLLHVIDSLATGGAERLAVDLCNGLAARGHEVHLVTTRAGGPLEVDVDGRVRRLELARRSTFDVGAVRRLRRHLREHRIELIHAHGTSVFVSLAATTLASHRPPTVYHDHLGARPAERRQRLPYRIVTRRAAAVIVVNEQLRSWHIDVTGVAPDRCFLLPNFSGLVVPRPIEGSGDAARDHALQVVAVGNVRPAKDYTTLLRAFAAVDPSLGARLSIAGSFVDRVETERIRAELAQLRLDDRVSLLGEVRDVAGLLQSADVGVSSSAAEGLPISVIEYGRAGLAVVATDVGGTAQVLDDGAAGRLVPSDDPDAFAAALTDVLTSAPLRAQLGDRLRRRVDECFSPERSIDDLEVIYERVRSI